MIMLYANELGVRRYESGETFVASRHKNSAYTTPFNVSEQFVVDDTNNILEIDTANDVKFL